jgi:hypothetical protein
MIQEINLDLDNCLKLMNKACVHGIHDVLKRVMFDSSRCSAEELVPERRTAALHPGRDYCSQDCKARELKGI